MSKQDRFASWMFSVVVATCLLVSGCVDKTAGPHGPELSPSAAMNVTSPGDVTVTDEFFGTLAIAKVTIEHPSARLVYRSGGVSDMIVRHMQATGNYRVIDWTNLQDVLARRNLEWSDLQKKEKVAREIQDVLFNDYFLMGTITSYGETMEYSASAFSKSKVQRVDATIELSVKDALTNEIVASVQGRGEERKTITQTLGFGAAGGIDTVIANKVLDEAIMDGVRQLTVKLAAMPQRQRASELTVEGTSETLRFHRSVKILCIFNETEEGLKDRSGHSNLENSSIGVSIAEHAMAMEFQRAGARVVTADDVVNHAYSITGGENLLSGGWASEQDFQEVENLLQARSGLASYAVSVGRTAKADIVVAGVVTYQVQDSVRNPGNFGGTQGSAFLAVKAIDVGKEEVLYLTSARQNFLAVAAPSGLNARTTALEIGAQKAARDIILQLQTKGF